MAVVINGSGTVTGLAVGGLPDGTVDAGTLATDSVTAVKIPDTVEADLKSGRKNLIINGAMQVAQRGDGTGLTTHGYIAPDRWQYVITTYGTWSLSQSTDAPDGSGYSYKFDCTTADASPAANDNLRFRQKIEGQNLQCLKFGSANAESLTASFWIKSNKTGTLQLNLMDNDNNKNISGTFTIDSAATWEYKTITFAGNTIDSLDNDANNSLMFDLFLGSGSTYEGGTVRTSWTTTVNADMNAGGTIDLADSTSNYLNITGVQLELGSQATDFEHRSYGEELALCQRYYQELMSNGADFHALPMWNLHANTMSSALHFPTPMRSAPSITRYGSVSNSSGAPFTSSSWSIYYAGGWKGCSSLSINTISSTTCRVDAGPYNTVGAGGAGGLYGGTGCYFTLDAEL